MRSILKNLFAPAKRRPYSVLRSLQPFESRLLLSHGHAALIPVDPPIVGQTVTTPANFSGQWEINTVPTFILTVNQNGSHVNGTFAGNDFHFDLKGTVHGQTLHLKGKGTNPNGPTKYTLLVTLNTPTSFEGTETFKSHGIPKEPLGVVGDLVP